MSSVEADCFLRFEDPQQARVQWRRLRRQFSMIGVLVLCVIAPALFLVYRFAAFGYAPVSSLPAESLRYIAICTLANVVVMAVAFNHRGDPGSRLLAGLSTAVILHGAVIFFVFVMREYYSRTVTVLSFLSSIGLVAAIALICDRWHPQRIGIIPTAIGPEAWDWIQQHASIVPSPQADISGFDLLIADWEATELDDWKGLISRATLSGCPVVHVAKYVEDRSGRVSLDHFELRHAINPSKEFYLNYNKRPLDVLIVTLSLPVLLPVLLVAALAILLLEGRPVFFTQKRIGQGNAPFNIYKLRTMRASDRGTISATSEGDHRITALGKVLRRYKSTKFRSSIMCCAAT